MAVVHTALTDGIGSTPVYLYTDSTDLPKTDYNYDEECWYGVNQPNNSGCRPGATDGKLYYYYLMNGGIKGNRLEAQWNYIEQSGVGVYDWSTKLTNYVDAIRATGGTVQIETGYTPMQYTGERYRNHPPIQAVNVPEQHTFSSNVITLDNPPLFVSNQYHARKGPFVVDLEPETAYTGSAQGTWQYLSDGGSPSYRSYTAGYAVRYQAYTPHYPIKISSLTLAVDEVGDGSWEVWNRIDRLAEATTDQKVYVADYTGRIAFYDDRQDTPAKRPANGALVTMAYEYYPITYTGNGTDYNITSKTNGEITRMTPESGVTAQTNHVDFSSGDPDTYFTWTGTDKVNESVADGALKMITTSTITTPGSVEYYARQTVSNGSSGDYKVTVQVSNYDVTPDDSFAFCGIRLNADNGDFLFWGIRTGLRYVKWKLRSGAYTYDTTYSGSLGTACKLEISRVGASYYLKAYDSGDTQVGTTITVTETLVPTSVDLYGFVYQFKAQTWWVEDFLFEGTADETCPDGVSVLYHYIDEDVCSGWGAALATQVDGKCNQFEYGNEVDSDASWTWVGGMETYANCFRAFRQGVLSVIPNAKVGFAGFADSQFDSAGVLLQYLDEDEYDFANCHPYKFYTGSLSSWETNMIDDFEDYLSAAGDTKRMKAGEMSAPGAALCGYPGSTFLGMMNGPTDGRQAEETIQMLMTLRRHGWSAVHLWPVTDLDPKGTAEANRWGNHDGLFSTTAGGAIPSGVKPVFYGVSNLANCPGIILDLGELQTVGTVNITSAYRERIDSIVVKGSLTCTSADSKPTKATGVMVGGTALFVVTIATGDADLVTETWTATCQAGGSTFAVAGTVSGAQGTATKEVAFTSNNGVCSFTIPAGTYSESQVFTWDTFKGDGFTQIGSYSGGLSGSGDISIDCADASARYLQIEFVKVAGVSKISLSQIAVLDDGDVNISDGCLYTVEGWQTNYIYDM